MPPSLEAWDLNHWTTRDVPSALFNHSIQYPFQIFLLKPFPSPTPDLHFFFLSGQRITGSQLSLGLQYFGRSLSGGQDLTKDGLVDLAVGARGHALLLR